MKRLLIPTFSVIFLATVVAFSSCSQPTSSTTTPPSHTVIYSIATTGLSSASSVSYTGANGTLVTVSPCSLPWTTTVTIQGGVTTATLQLAGTAPNPGSANVSGTIIESGNTIGTNGAGGTNGAAITFSMSPTL